VDLGKEKGYLIRTNEVNAALSLQNNDSNQKGNREEMMKRNRRKKKVRSRAEKERMKKRKR
jgi:hypothetical protein